MHLVCAGETSTLANLDTESWTRDLRQIQGRPTFQRLDLERVIAYMRVQVCSRSLPARCCAGSAWILNLRAAYM